HKTDAKINNSVTCRRRGALDRVPPLRLHGKAEIGTRVPHRHSPDGAVVRWRRCRVPLSVWAVGPLLRCATAGMEALADLGCRMARCLRRHAGRSWPAVSRTDCAGGPPAAADRGIT